MTLSSTHEFRKFLSTLVVGILLHPRRATGFLFALLLLLCGWWPLRDHLFEIDLKSKESPSFSSVVVGVFTTQEYFNSRFGFQLSTFLREILDKDGNVVVSVERSAVPLQNFKRRMTFVDHSVTSRVTLFESRCPMGYEQLLCRTIELLRIMSEAYPAASWYIRIDDDTLLLPKPLYGLLRGLNPRDTLAVGSPSFYFCTSPLKCTHRRYPGLRWKEIDQVTKLIRGGAGYILSCSVVSWIISNDHEIMATATQLGSYAEDLVIFFSLRKLMKRLEIIQARSFHFERPEVALRTSPFHSTSDMITPVSFHMHHNLVNGYALYRNLHKLPKEVREWVSEKDNYRDDDSSQTLTRIRSQVSWKLRKCVLVRKGVKMESRNFYQELRKSLIDIFLVRLVKQLDEMLGGYDCKSLFDALEKEVKEMRTKCVYETKEKKEVIMIETASMTTQVVYGFQSRENRKNAEIKKAGDKKSTAFQTLLRKRRNDEQRLSLSRLGFAETIDLLVDCEDDGKIVRHQVEARRKRKKSLWEWNALHSVRGYSKSRVTRSGLSWKMRYLEYMSYLTDNWTPEEGECMGDCAGRVEMQLLDLVLYLRRGRVVLTEKREHHLALAVLRIPHVYIRNEGDKKLRTTPLCTGDLPLAKCVSSLSAATEALADFLLGESFLNHS